MRDYVDIGPVPAGEECEQLGPNYDSKKARRECQAFIRQIIRQIGLQPTGARLAIKANQHDYGTYHEVVCYYHEDYPDSVDYAFRCESEMPEHWDDIAKQELSTAAFHDAIGGVGIAR
jgi:hypothetical protein